jgi:regulation of enolase protein 1 (concanavalin A-like superfamily)
MPAPEKVPAMRATRRQILTAALAAPALTTLAAAQAPNPSTTPLVPGSTAPPRSGGDLLSRMSWLNPPAQESYTDGGVTARSKGRTDFWRKTFYGYITDNGHFLNTRIAGDFMFQARVDGNYAALYDQAGLMVRLDETTWMKCGTELVEGERWASVVFTRDFSDWSTMPDLTQVGPVYWRVVRKKDSIEAQCSRDGEKYLTIRQGYFPAKAEVMVGVMVASPEGTGLDATFDQLLLEKTSKRPQARVNSRGV